MDSIIFDLDGTLWDSIDTVLASWNDCIADESQVQRPLVRADFEQTMGLQMEVIADKLFPYLDESVRAQLLEACCRVENEYIAQRGGQLYPHVNDVLRKLSARYKLFIVSNCQDGYIEAFYSYHKLERYFTDYENPGRTGLPKGENIKLIIERNQLTDPVYVGDTEGDYQAAKFAGIPFIYAAYGFGQVSGYDQVIETFEELGALFEEGVE